MALRAVKSKKRLTIIQKSFSKGTVTVLEQSRVPKDGLIDMTNMDLVQDSLIKPRQSTVALGPVALGTIIGIGTFTKLNAGLPERWQITMQVISGVGQIVINKDSASWTIVGGSYNVTAWCQFTQSNSRVYVSNGMDSMSYYDINTGSITVYSPLTSPVAPTLAKTGLSGSTQTYYYAYSANNKVGETLAVISAPITVGKLRDQWVNTTDAITATGTAVTGAISYNWYISTTNLITDFQYLATTATPTLNDDGSTIINIFKIPSTTDSTGGPKLSYLINDNGQLFGVGDPANPYNLWYSGKGAQSGNFAPAFGNGGGYAYINYGGDSVPTCVQAFRDGKGNPVITVLTKGQGGAGKFYHASENTTSYSESQIRFYDVYEANGQSGTISPFGVVQANNNIYYPTGDNFKSTGTQANIVNILATNSVSQAIDPDVRGLNLKAMSKCIGLYYRDRIFWALPNGTSTNSEIWVLDLSRNNAWILRWTLPADYLWLYEDNSGVTHFCALVSNRVVEFTSSVATQDQGIAFRTRAATGSLTWDDSGISMAAVQQQIFKLSYPRGTIYVNDYGVTEDGQGQQTLGNSVYRTSVSNTGYGQWDYSGQYYYGYDVGYVDYFSQATGTVTLEPDETISELSAEIITTDANTDYTLSTVTTIGTLIPNLYRGGA